MHKSDMVDRLDGGGELDGIARLRLAENLSALLDFQGLSQRAFSRRSGIARSQVTAVLARERNVRVDSLECMATALRVMVWRMLAPERQTADVCCELIDPVPARVVLSTRIKCESSKLGLTLADLAQHSGCPSSHLYEIVSRRRCTGIDTLPSIARTLRIELHDLFVPATRS